MYETAQIILWIFALIAVYVLTRKIAMWRTGRSFNGIINDLKGKYAVDPSTAVQLPYAKRELFKPGLRDFRTEGLKFLVAQDIVGITDDGRYYLKEEPQRTDNT